MKAPDFLSVMTGLFKGDLKFREPMSLHTSWRIGGPAEIFVEPRGIEDLKVLTEYVRRYKLSLTVIGAGTNVLVKDGGISGVVLQMGSGFSDIRVEGAIISAGGGVRLSRLASIARDATLGGFEFLSGIPGTVGGAVVMNAGANGSSVSGLIRQINCIDFEGNLLSLNSGQLDWGYRRSGLQGRGKIVVEAVFEGIPRDKDIISSDMEKYMGSRKASQPLEYPNSGSVFKNPPLCFAGKLIQDAGCRGMRIGDAQVSEKHANFIVNLGRAKAGDVLQLIAAVRDRVFDKYGVDLEMEVKVLGRD
ncbi:MAG: UDP-N-acetylmuramate dehydrogenase [Desulfocucumaceae bacterium]